MAQLTESLFDTSLGANPSKQVKDREVKNTMQELKKIQRVGRRAYRNALRNKDYGKAMQALDWTKSNAGDTGAGIAVAGQLQRGLEQRQAYRDSQFAAPNVAPAGDTTRPEAPQGTGPSPNDPTNTWVDVSPNPGPLSNPQGQIRQMPFMNPGPMQTPLQSNAPMQPRINGLTGMPLGTQPGDAAYNPAWEQQAVAAQSNPGPLMQSVAPATYGTGTQTPSSGWLSSPSFVGPPAQTNQSAPARRGTLPKWLDGTQAGGLLSSLGL